MDAIVTARVPVEVKDQVGAILREIGSTPTQLINRAYEYVLAKRELPTIDVEYDGGVRDPKSGKRVVVITKEMRAELKRMEKRCTFDLPQSFWDEVGDRDLTDYIADIKWRDYEALG